MLSNVMNVKTESGWQGNFLQDRIRAGAIHFLATLAIAVCITIPLVYWLYPAPFFAAAGGLTLLGLIVAVDSVLGPLLTFLVFDRRKKSLRLDLAIVVLLQLSALAYGLYAIALSRPVFMAFTIDRYEMVSFARLDPDELKKAPLEFQKLQWGHPQVVFAKLPDDRNQRENLLFGVFAGNGDLSQFARYYRPISEAKNEILARAQEVKALYAVNDKARVDKVLSRFGQSPIVFIPLQGLKRDLTAIIDKSTGALLEVVDLKPWADVDDLPK